MPVGVAHQRVEDHHVAERLIELVAQLLQFVSDLGKFLLREAAVNRHKGMVDVREKFAGAAQRSLPFRQFVGNVVQSHCLGDLGCVELRIRLVAGVRRAGTAAFVEQDLPADTPPALAQVPVGGELRRRRKRARPHTSESGPGDQRQRLVEAVLIEVVVLELAVEAIRHDPVAVVHGEPHAQLDDAEDVVVVQSVDGEDLVHELAVAGNDAGLQPVEQTPVGDFEPQRKQSAVFLRFFQDRADETIQPLRPQVEGDQLRIVLFQDEFHLKHTVLFRQISRISHPPPTADCTNTHYNIQPPPMKSTLTRRIPQKYCRKGATKAVAEFYPYALDGAGRLKNAEKFAKVDGDLR